jgi:L-Ala-D/L-Glu epimerase
LRVESRPVEARLRAPFVTSRGAIRSVSLQLVSLTDDDGVVGHGDEVRPHHGAGLDIARWDLAGRRAGQPVWQLLGAADAPAVEVNATIAADDLDAVRRSASDARGAGFRCVKVKVGLDDDVDRVAAVREAGGPEMAIRLDANGAWSVEQAIASMRELEPFGIELCEQPAADADGCARVAAASSVAVSLDESAPDALDRRVCDAVCLKVARFGGITGVIEAARRARQAGYRVYLASMLDGPLGIAAALHAAAAIQPDYACGLATLSLFEGRTDPLPASDGRIGLPVGPGLGDGLLAWYCD